MFFGHYSSLKLNIMKGNYQQYQSCIEACLQCATICNNCSSSCTQEQDVQKMALCIQLSMECAALCYSTAQLLSLGSKKAKEVARICAQLCEACGTECAKH